jgi:hypothetical protein
VRLPTTPATTPAKQVHSQSVWPAGTRSPRKITSSSPAIAQATVPAIANGIIGTSSGSVIWRSWRRGTHQA